MEEFNRLYPLVATLLWIISVPAGVSGQCTTHGAQVCMGEMQQSIDLSNFNHMAFSPDLTQVCGMVQRGFVKAKSCLERLGCLELNEVTAALKGVEDAINYLCENPGKQEFLASLPCYKKSSVGSNIVSCVRRIQDYAQGGSPTPDGMCRVVKASLRCISDEILSQCDCRANDWMATYSAKAFKYLASAMNCPLELNTCKARNTARYYSKATALSGFDSVIASAILTVLVFVGQHLI